jgi:succinate-semialdehyde dehydrogenase/glutarate-semialdehyde dehydrogenase
MKKSINPYDGKVLYEFRELQKEEIGKGLALAQKTFGAWKKTDMAQRATYLREAAAILERNKLEYATVITKEMGKPLKQSLAEVEKCAWVCTYYAENATQQLKDEPIGTDADRSYVRYEPLGVVLAVMPWNFPFWQVFRFAAPTLMAGNVGILKHASNVLKSGDLIQEIFEEAGFPNGCFQHLIVDSEKIGDILADPCIKAVSLTGSTGAGASVASIAGRNIKKSVLELGGSNALIVFDDADVDQAVETCINARFLNTGQSCIAGKRLLVQEAIAREFMEKFREGVAALKHGDPMHPDTFIGVMAKEELVQELEDQVNRSLKMGAHLLLGGKRKGNFYEPTILTNVTAKMPVFTEETFGPVMAMATFDTDLQAVALANASQFGLGVSLFTRDMDRVERLIPEFNEGAVFVNELVKSDPRLPFGGVKASGYGRELSSHGIREFVNMKTVYIKK